MSQYRVGIDGGGTSCRAAVAGLDGRILGRGKSGAANILTDPDTALVHIVEATEAAFADAGLSADLLPKTSAILGLAGNNVGDAVAYVLARLPFREAAIESDGLIALQGAIGDRDGAIAILGTGTIFIARHEQKDHHIGGWGFFIGDLGSGARLGQAALQESLLAYDGMIEQTPLTEAILRKFGGLPGHLVEFARLARPGDFGRYAPAVFEHAAEGDATGLRILRQAASTVNMALDRICTLIGKQDPICLLGGLAHLYPAYLAERHRARLAMPVADALTGAVALAVKRFRGDGEQAA